MRHIPRIGATEPGRFGIPFFFFCPLKQGPIITAYQKVWYWPNTKARVSICSPQSVIPLSSLLPIGQGSIASTHHIRTLRGSQGNVDRSTITRGRLFVEIFGQERPERGAVGMRIDPDLEFPGAFEIGIPQNRADAIALTTPDLFFFQFRLP